MRINSSGLVSAETRARLKPKYNPRNAPAWSPSHKPTGSVDDSAMTLGGTLMQRTRRYVND